MTDRMKGMLDEAEAIREDLDLFHDLASLAMNYDEVIYRLVNLADRVRAPQCVVPTEVADPRRVELATTAATELVNRLRYAVERLEKSDASFSTE